MREISIKSLSDLEQFALSLKNEIPAGSVIFLNGEMGAGKTSFVQAFAKSLGITNPVRSPSFIIQNEYIFENNSKLNHLDLYRLENLPELTELNIDKISSPYSYTFIEWADKFEDDLKNIFSNSDIFKIDFKVINETERLITFTEL